MHALLLALKVVLATAAAIIITGYAIASINLNGIMGSNWTAKGIIRQRCPAHVVRPEWIIGSNQTDILFRWMVAETRARVIVVFTFWILAVALIVWRHLARNRHEHRTLTAR